MSALPSMHHSTMAGASKLAFLALLTLTPEAIAAPQPLGSANYAREARLDKAYGSATYNSGRSGANGQNVPFQPARILPRETPVQLQGYPADPSGVPPPADPSVGSGPSGPDGAPSSAATSIDVQGVVQSAIPVIGEIFSWPRKRSYDNALDLEKFCDEHSGFCDKTMPPHRVEILPRQSPIQALATQSAAPIYTMSGEAVASVAQAATATAYVEAVIESDLPAVGEIFGWRHKRQAVSAQQPPNDQPPNPDPAAKEPSPADELNSVVGEILGEPVRHKRRALTPSSNVPQQPVAKGPAVESPTAPNQGVQVINPRAAPATVSQAATATANAEAVIESELAVTEGLLGWRHKRQTVAPKNNPDVPKNPSTGPTALKDPPSASQPGKQTVDIDKLFPGVSPIASLIGRKLRHRDSKPATEDMHFDSESLSPRDMNKRDPQVYVSVQSPVPTPNGWYKRDPQVYVSVQSPVPTPNAWYKRVGNGDSPSGASSGSTDVEDPEPVRRSSISETLDPRIIAINQADFGYQKEPRLKSRELTE